MRPDIDRQRTDEPSSLGEANGEVTIIFNVLPAQWETVQQLAEAQGVTIDQLLNQAISHLAEICAVIERGDLVTLETPMPFGRLRRLLGLPDARQRDIIFFPPGTCYHEQQCRLQAAKLARSAKNARA